MLQKIVITGLILAIVQGCTGKKVTLVVVDKSERKMTLKKHGKAIKTYDVALGKEPVGPKLRQGDNKTPEGVYMLNYKNRNSKFYRSIHISYPNYRDRLRAWRLGVNPGNSIVIHGMLNGISQKQMVQDRGPDWTNGCIAVKNSDMQEIWSLVRVETPILIKP